MHTRIRWTVWEINSERTTESILAGTLAAVDDRASTALATWLVRSLFDIVATSKAERIQ